MQANEDQIDRAIRRILRECFEALEAAEEYFDNRADADCDQDGFIPNEEMRLLNRVSSALNDATGVRKAIGGTP